MTDQIRRFRLAAARPKIRAQITRDGQKLGAIAFHSVDALKLFLDKIPFKANERVEFTGQDFSGADFSGVDFQMCHFKNCDFSNAKMAGADFTACLLHTCDFSGADMRNANLEYAEISESVFTGADVTGVDFGMTYGAMAEPPEPARKKRSGFGRHWRPW